MNDEQTNEGSTKHGSTNDAHGDQPSQPRADGGSSAADDSGMGISDDQLPEDLRPTDDNPLAKPPSDDEDGPVGGSSAPDASGAAPGADPGAPA